MRGETHILSAFLFGPRLRTRPRRISPSGSESNRLLDATAPNTARADVLAADPPVLRDADSLDVGPPDSS